MTRAVRVPTMTEAELLDAIVVLARILGWSVAHFRPARTEHGWRTAMSGDKGFPDLVLAKAGRTIFAELKSDAGRVAPEQNLWIDALSGGCNLVAVWRPKHWHDGTIESVLRGPRILDEATAPMRDAAGFLRCPFPSWVPAANEPCAMEATHPPDSPFRDCERLGCARARPE